MDGCSPGPSLPAKEMTTISPSAQGDLFPGQLDLQQESALTASSNRQFSGRVKSGFITYFLKDAFFENTYHNVCPLNFFVCVVQIKSWDFVVG